MNRTGKRVLAAGLAVTLVAGLGAGGVYLAKNRQKAEVNVYSIYDVGMTEYWGDSRTTSGMVTTDQIQNVYISTTQMVQEIYVQEGQTVRKGDLLLSYDTTLSTLELERKDLEIQKMELSLEEARKDLKKIQGYRPGVPVSEDDLVSTGSSLGGLSVSASGTGNVQSASAGNMQAAAAGTLLSRGGKGAAAQAAEELASFTWGAAQNAAGLRLMAGGLLGGSLSSGAGRLWEAPADPTESLEESSEAPTDPTENPMDPTENPTDPTETPTDPTETPTDPTETPTEPSGEPTEPTENPTEPTETPTEPSESPTEPVPAKPEPELVRGDGTKEQPYLYLWKTGLSYAPAFLEQLLGEKTEVWAQFMLRENDSLEGLPLSSWVMRLSREEGEIRFEIQSVAGPEEDPLVIPDDPGTVDPGPDIPIGPIGPSGPTYTAAEIAQMREEKEREIRDLDLNIRVARVEYGKLEKELNDGSVRAEVDGVVKSVGDVETAAVDHQPLVTVAGGEGGYYVQGSVSELDLETVKVGQPVSVMSWMTMETAEGTIQAISDMPVSGGYWDGVGNPNSSYYTFTVFIDGNATFENGDYLEITYTPQAVEGEGTSLYLQTPFVRSEDGQSYVYVKGADGKLERRNVTVGKSLYGSYTEIRSGLTAEDMVAFPYGKDVKEGAPARDGSLEDLYNSMGY